MYLRNDIPCGFNSCKKCFFDGHKGIQHVYALNYSKSIDFEHFLIFDGPSLLKFIDVMDEPILKYIFLKIFRPY